MTTRRGRRRRHRLHKRRSRIGPDFGCGVRRLRELKDEDLTMMAVAMRYDRRDDMPEFQAWHFAKFGTWPRRARAAVADMLAADRASPIDYLVLGSETAATVVDEVVETRRKIEREFYLDLDQHLNPTQPGHDGQARHNQRKD